ncbi:MAG: FtsX-like permease family protein, partial [Lachnospiraceae bacterium]
MTPDYLQMHAGSIQTEKINEFAKEHPEIEKWQICPFLNLENSSVILGNSSLADSTQDNGLCVQNDGFDYLLDSNNVCPVVKEGEVYVPVCYRSMYDLNIGDKMQIGNEELIVAGFIRDSQMSSMMASSKRFLVSKTDYEEIKKLGEEEYLIEFLLKEDTDTDSFTADYGKAGLYANGPTITKPLIRMMNALSDGIMILVIFLVGIGVLLISLLCIRFITALGVEQDRKEVGMLKALGIENKHICFLYLSKYMLFSVVGAVLGLLGAGILERPLSGKLRELYGVSDKGLLSVAITFLACILVQAVILLFIRHVLKKIEIMSTLEALFSVQTNGKKKERSQYVIIGLVVVACMAFTLIPQNLYSTISSPQFVTYMGIGDAGIRMDVRQSEDIVGITENLLEELGKDSDVLKYVALKTVSCPVILSDGSQVNLIVETGDHSVFPVKYAEGKQPEKEGEIA